jgi:hypothetical protein
MLFSNACLFVLFSLVSLSANAETVRGAQRELEEPEPIANVTLGVAGNFAILAQSGISTVADSAITGDIAVSPIAGGAMTGFTLVMQGGTYSTDTSNQLVGQAYAASYDEPTPTYLIAAVGAMGTAYLDAEGRTNDNAARKNINGGILTEVTLTPGVYTFTTNLHLTGSIYLDATKSTDGEDVDDPNAIFIIQIAGNLLQDAGFKVLLAGGAKAENIFWQIAGNVAVMAGAHMEGVLLVKTDVTFITGSTLNGRVLAQTACNLQKATITEPFHANVVY